MSNKNNIINFCTNCFNHTSSYQTKAKTLEKIRSKPEEIDKSGFCTVCKFERDKKVHNINWKGRERILKKLVSSAKKNSQSGYDCIIPVSGGKDSMRQAFIVRDQLKMKPLLISVFYPPE